MDILMKQMPTEGEIPRPSLKAHMMSSDSLTPRDEAIRDLRPEEVLGLATEEVRVRGRLDERAVPPMLRIFVESVERALDIEGYDPEIEKPAD